ncbi:MAG: hypothetical protein ACRCW2_08070, partial [Cellulosilyticaceae bacterium]
MAIQYKIVHEATKWDHRIGIEAIEAIQERVFTTGKRDWVGMIQDDDQAYRPDLLLVQEYMTVAAQHIEGIWIEINIPKNNNIGRYEGAVGITCQEMFQDEIELGVILFAIDVKEKIGSDSDQIKALFGLIFNTVVIKDPPQFYH